MDIPKGFTKIDFATVYMSTHEIVVCGTLEEDDENHNCDHMGCSSVSHVIFRGPLPNSGSFYDSEEGETHE